MEDNKIIQEAIRTRGIINTHIGLLLGILFAALLIILFY
ncbi:hypothetical protein ES703_10783 [subsurface metagenome]